MRYRGPLINFQCFKDHEVSQILFNLDLILEHAHSFREENTLHSRDDNQIKNCEFNSLMVCIFSCTEFFQNVMPVRRLHHYQKVTLIRTTATQW